MPAAGEVIGQRYSILSALATGGMGSVYRARHVLSRREVALKVLHIGAEVDPAAAERFRLEASAAAEIGHRGLVQVLDAGVDAERGSYFIAMELLEGMDLARRLRREGTTLGDGLGLIAKLLDPLAAVHRRSYVHRDLKPENVFVLPEDEVKLLDFGVAKHLGARGATLTGAALGTPHYMAPEQILDSRNVTPASDVWSVGVMLYEVATGRRPFEGETPGVLIRACMERPDPVRERAGHLGTALGLLIDRCLAREPGARPADASALATELREAMDAELALDAPLMLEPRASRTRPLTPLPSTIATAPLIDWMTVRSGPLTLELPPGWRSRHSLVPYVAGSWEGPEVLDDMRPRVVVKVEPWEGDTASYTALGIENMRRIAVLARMSDSMLLDRPCLEIDALAHNADPPQRWLRRAVVIDGVGYVASCDAAISRFDDLLPIFRGILGSMRFS